MKKSKKKTKKRRVDFQNEASRWTKCFSLDRFMFFVCFHHAPIAFLIFKSSRHVFGLCSSSASCFRFLFYPEKLSQSCNRWAMRMGGIWSGRRCWPYNTARIPTREHTHTLREKKTLKNRKGARRRYRANAFLDTLGVSLTNSFSVAIKRWWCGGGDPSIYPRSMSWYPIDGPVTIWGPSSFTSNI